MRVLLRLLLPVCFFSCGTLGHTLDDLNAVHEEKKDLLTHRFQVERYNWFTGYLHYGPIGDLMGSARYSQKGNKPLEDPFEFCSDRVVALGSYTNGSFPELVDSISIAGKILLMDPYVLSRIFASETLVKIGKDVISPETYDSSLEIRRVAQYDEKRTARLQEIVAMQKLKEAGKATAQDLENYRKYIVELAVISYETPQEGFEVANLMKGVYQRESGKERIFLAQAGSFILARGLTQALIFSLGDPNEFVRENSLKSLHQLFGKKIITDVLQSRADDPSAIVRRRIVLICGELTLQEAETVPNNLVLEFLEKAFRDPNGSVAVNAMNALSKMLKIEPKYEREYWRSWFENYWLKGKP